MQIPIRLRDVLRPQPRIRVKILEHLLRFRNVDNAIDDRVRDVNALRSEFLRERHAHGAERPFRRGECGHLRVGFDGGGGAGEDEGRWVLGRLVFGML